jgi:hypothetical protein
MPQSGVATCEVRVTLPHQHRTMFHLSIALIV